MDSYFTYTNGTCEGCLKAGFTETGLSQHLRQSKRSTLCLAYFDCYIASLAQPPSTASSRSQPPSPQAAASPPTPLPLFNPDLDLEMMDDDDKDEEYIEHFKSDSEDGGFTDLEDDWEPEPEPQGHVGSGGSTASHVCNTDAYFGPSVSPEARRAAEERAGQGPQIIVQFTDTYPESQAGSVLSQTTSAAQNDDGSANIYALFVSQMDWEIAKWAKLRGPGSTAFSDLLGIDGVCVHLLNLASIALIDPSSIDS
jgi:hypothetical protein